MLSQPRRDERQGSATGTAVGSPQARRPSLQAPTVRRLGRQATFEIRRFDPRDAQAVLALLRSVFGRWPHGLGGIPPAEFFRWKHAESPLGRSDMRVAELRGEVIGFHAFMPWRFLAHGDPVAAMRGVDLAVHADHRRIGVSVALRSAVEFDPHVALLWSNPNDEGREGSLKLGHREVSRVARFIRPTRAARGAIGFAARRSIGPSTQTPFPTQSAGQVLAAEAPGSRLPPGTPWRSDRLTTDRDLAYLRWRYGPFEDYRAIRVGRGVETAGIAIFRRRQHGSMSVAHICDLLVEPGDRETTRKLLHEVGEAATADFISCNFASRAEAARYGFLPLPGTEPLMSRSLAPTPSLDPARRRSWALSHGDLELL
jgi:GNAT superfamily N-acetyltransferase